MYWKCVFIHFLLVIPHNRIFILAEVETRSDFARAADSTLTDDALVDKIIQELQAGKQQGSSVQTADDSLNRAVEDDAVRNSGMSDQIPQGEKKDGVAPKDPADGAENKTTPKNNRGGSEPGNSVPPAVPGNAAPLEHHEHVDDSRGSGLIDTEDKIFIIIIAVAVSTGFIGLMLAGVCYYRFRRSAKAASDVEYPAYGVTGPMKDRVPSPGDRKLAQSAQMYHYQHQKQQMIAMEKANGDMKHDASEDDSDEDNLEGDYTVYECPGLAPTGEMEIRNPLFRGEDTPVTPGEDITGQPHEQEPEKERGNQ
ncbi:hypothetical protein BsWGS_08639 [Bradybaena similaris]